MKHLKKFNEKVRADYEQDDNRVFSDDMDRLVSFVRDNEDYVLEAIEHWETAHGRDFKGSDFYKWFDDYMLYEGEDERIVNEWLNYPNRAAIPRYKSPKEIIKSELVGNQYQMVSGIIDILRKVKDIDNRMEIAYDMIEQFKRENIKFNYNNFLDSIK